MQITPARTCRGPPRRHRARQSMCAPARNSKRRRIDGSILLSQDLMQDILAKWDRSALTVFVDHQGVRAHGRRRLFCRAWLHPGPRPARRYRRLEPGNRPLHPPLPSRVTNHERISLQQRIQQAIADPKNVGELPGADAVGTVGSPDCGDMLRMWIKFKDQDGRRVIDRATFQTFGCETAIAVASVATELISGKTAGRSPESFRRRPQRPSGSAAPDENPLRPARRRRAPFRPRPRAGRTRSAPDAKLPHPFRPTRRRRRKTRSKSSSTPPEYPLNTSIPCFSPCTKTPSAPSPAIVRRSKSQPATPSFPPAAPSSLPNRWAAVTPLPRRWASPASPRKTPMRSALKSSQYRRRRRAARRRRARRRKARLGPTEDLLRSRDPRQHCRSRPHLRLPDHPARRPPAHCHRKDDPHRPRLRHGPRACPGSQGQDRIPPRRGRSQC